MTDSLRKSKGDAAGASPTDLLDVPAIRRTLIGAILIGLFLAVVGAFGTDQVPLPYRAAALVSIALIGAGTGMAAYRLTGHVKRLAARPYLRGLTGGLLQSPVMTLVIMGLAWILDGQPPPWQSFFQDYPVVLVVCLTMSVLAPALNRQASVAKDAEALLNSTPTPPRFLERLPLKLRGAEIWAVEAEDHYLRLHTSKGQDLILMRLSDAIEELAGLEGEQVHRSWWVARDGVTDIERGDGRAILTLKNGEKAPVSRTYAKIIREKGWF